MGIQEIENKINEVVSLIRYEENRIEINIHKIFMD